MTFDGLAPSAWVNDGGEIWWYLHPFGRLFPLEIVQLDSLEQAIPKLRELFGQ